jgi:hypothetical protein
MGEQIPKIIILPKIFLCWNIIHLNEVAELDTITVLILSEITVNCVIWFDKFVRILKGPMEIEERGHYFQCSA